MKSGFFILVFAMVVSCASVKDFPKEAIVLDDVVALLVKTEEEHCQCRVEVRDSTITKYSPWLKDTRKIEDSMGWDEFTKLLHNYESQNKTSILVSYTSRSDSENIAKMGFSNFGIDETGTKMMIYVQKVYGPLDAVGKIYIYEIKKSKKGLELIPLHEIKMWVS